MSKLSYGAQDIPLPDDLDVSLLRDRVTAALRDAADPWLVVTDHHGTEFSLLLQPGVPVVVTDTSDRDTAEESGHHVFGS